MSTPALADAYRRGELSWLRALTILPVARDREVATEWVTRAREVTLRRLGDEVAWALEIRDQVGGAASTAPPPIGHCLVRRGRQIGAPRGGERLDAEIRFTAPASVVALLRGAITAFSAPTDAMWMGFEKLLKHARLEWEGQPRHRDPVFARDGWRCAVPACSSRRNLHDHHINFRSRGGGNARGNRITICAWHHLRGIHAGRVRAWGRAPDAIHWAIGLRSDRPPLLELVGERYQSDHRPLVTLVGEPYEPAAERPRDGACRRPARFPATSDETAEDRSSRSAEVRR